MKFFILSLILIIQVINLASAVIVDAGYTTFYPGEEETISLKVENNENFDIEDVSISLDLSNFPFTSIGSSSKDLDDLDENDDDSITFILIPSTDIAPGNYDIPYKIKYSDANNSSLKFIENGSFGVRVSAKTELDFSAETRDVAVAGKEGQFSVEIINRGLGEVRSVSVQIVPSGFELLSGNKVFIGTIDSDDSDSAVFDVIYKNKDPTFSAIISYKDFDNKNQTETTSLKLKTYTEEEALKLGLIKKNNNTIYIAVVIAFLILWYFWRKIRKRKKLKERQKMSGQS